VNVALVAVPAFRPYVKGRAMQRDPMTEIATTSPVPQRALIAVAVLFGVLLAVALALWGYYGTAVFTEMIMAGLAACF
jgi:hypothetical protein